MSDKWERHCGAPIILEFENSDGTVDAFHLKFTTDELPVIMALNENSGKLNEEISKKIINMLVTAIMNGEPGAQREKVEGFVITNFIDILYSLDGTALGMSPKTDKVKAKLEQMQKARGSQ